MNLFWCRKCGDKQNYHHMCFRDGSSRRFKTKKQMDTVDTRHITVRFMERLMANPQLAPLIQEDAQLERLYSGRREREEGAWSWHLISSSDIRIGSIASMTECFKAKELQIVGDSKLELIPIN